VEIHLERYADAAQHLAFGLQNIPPREDTDLVKRSVGLLDLAKQHVAVLKLSVDRQGAEVRDGTRLLGRSPIVSDIYLDPGTHWIQAHLGEQVREQKIEVTAKGTMSMELVFGPEPASPSTATQAAPTPSEPAAPSRDQSAGVDARTIVLISGAAVSVIGLATTIVFAAKRSSANSDVEALQRSLGPSGSDLCLGSTAPPSCADLQARIDDRDRASTAFNIALPITAVAAVGTAITFFAWPKRDNAVALHPSITPLVGRGTAGLTLGGQF
jgi:hypothetical protein